MATVKTEDDATVTYTKDDVTLVIHKDNANMRVDITRAWTNPATWEDLVAVIDAQEGISG